MATEFIATVKSSSGDYTSLSAAEAGLQNDLTAATIKVFSISAASTPMIVAGDTVLGQTSAATGVCVLVNAARTQALIKTIAVAAFQSGEVVQKTLDAAVNVTLSNAGDSPIARIDCYAMEDTTAVTIDGWTTDATRYVRINVPDSDRHNGLWNTSAYRLSINGAVCLTVVEAYTRCEGLQVEDVGSAASHNLIVFSGGNYFRFGYGIVRKSVSDLTVNTGFMSATNGNTAYIYNTLIYDIGSGGFDDSGAGAFIYWYNCTTQNCAIRGYHSWGNRGVFKNCIAQDCGDGFTGNIDTTNSTNNCSDIAGDAPGSNPSTGEVTFTNEAGDDFSLAAGDAYAKDLGTDLSADPVFPFSDDIINVTRSDTWDIGAFAYITAGGGGSSIQGVAAGVATTLGALVLGLALASSGICASTDSCALSLGLDLRGSAQSSSITSCTIDVQAAPGATSIEGSTTAVSAANGSIGLGLRLQGEATSASVAQGALGLGLRLNGVADGATTAGLELRLGAGLGGTSAGTTTGVGGVTAGWVLQGTTTIAMTTTTCELGGGTAIIPAAPTDYRVEIKILRALTNTACVERRAAVTVQVAQHAAIAVRAI